jgi:hypothetical protein
MASWRKATLEELPWQPIEGFPGVSMRFLGDSQETGPWVMHVRHRPNYQEPRHWHEADTVYVFTAGEMTIGEEGTYRPGDVRWVREGTFYGPETAGAEGCEFLLIGAGSPMMHYEAPESPAAAIGERGSAYRVGDGRARGRRARGQRRERRFGWRHRRPRDG